LIPQVVRHQWKLLFLEEPIDRTLKGDFTRVLSVECSHGSWLLQDIPMSLATIMVFYSPLHHAIPEISGGRIQREDFHQAEKKNIFLALDRSGRCEQSPHPQQTISDQAEHPG
jgi:hypothetical protein